MSNLLTIIRYRTLGIITISLVCISILAGCSKDDGMMTQENLVKISNDYKKTLEDIATSEKLIAQLTEKLETAEDSEKLIIQAQIDNETSKLEQLQDQRIELEKKLGIKSK